jgi:hypothetical protein
MAEATEPTTKKRARGELKIPVDADDIGEDKVSVYPKPIPIVLSHPPALLILTHRKTEEIIAAADAICQRRAMFARTSHGLSAKTSPMDRSRIHRFRWRWTRIW